MYVFVVLGLPDGMLGTAWPALRHGFGVPLDGLGIILLLGTAGAVCTSSVSGVVLARIGLRPTLMLAGALGALGALVAILSPAFWTFALGGTAIGMTAGLMDSSLNSAVALARRNRLLNVLHGCYGIGTTIGPLVVTAAILAVSWRPAYGVLLLAEVGLMAGWWAVGRRGRRSPIRAASPEGPLQAGPPASAGACACRSRPRNNRQRAGASPPPGHDRLSGSGRFHVVHRVRSIRWPVGA